MIMISHGSYNHIRRKLNGEIHYFLCNNEKNNNKQKQHFYAWIDLLVAFMLTQLLLSYDHPTGWKV